MYRAIVRTILFALLAVVAAGIGWFYLHTTADTRKIAELEEKTQQLRAVVDRLTTDKRVADLFVLDQQTNAGHSKTDVLFVEYNRKGEAMPARLFTIEGEAAHVEAMVIEFNRDLVVANDPLKGHSIALFTRIFGDDQAPSTGPRIDVPGSVPLFYRDVDSHVVEFEQKLWQQFWQFESDKTLREASGVRVATGKGVWGPLEKGYRYTITLEPTGNLSRTAEPIDGVYDKYITAMRDKLAGK